MVEGKADASRSTALRRLNVRCCSHFGRKVRHCGEVRRAQFSLYTADRSAAVRQFYCMRSDPTLSGRLCSTVRRSDAVQPPSARLRSGPTPFGRTCAEDPTLFGRFLLYWADVVRPLLLYCKRISCCSDKAQHRSTIAP